jgi:hypothetical protein
VASETLLQDLIKEYESKGPVFRRQVHLVMRSSYRSHYRRILPHLLDVLEFHCNNELYQPIIRAVTLVKDYVHSPRQYYPEEEIVPIKDIVKAKWRDLVVEKDEDGTEKATESIMRSVSYKRCATRYAARRSGSLGPTAIRIPIWTCPLTLNSNAPITTRPSNSPQKPLPL